MLELGAERSGRRHSSLSAGFSGGIQHRPRKVPTAHTASKKRGTQVRKYITTFGKPIRELRNQLGCQNETPRQSYLRLASVPESRRIRRLPHKNPDEARHTWPPEGWWGECESTDNNSDCPTRRLRNEARPVSYNSRSTGEGATSQLPAQSPASQWLNEDCLPTEIAFVA